LEDSGRTVAVNTNVPYGQGWIVSPLYDLLFLANLGWMLLLLPGFASTTDTAIDFWQMYFLTLPHRWITLVVVLLDPDRRDGRGWLLWLIAGLAALIVFGTFLSNGAFLCLAVVDFIWNAWHFASQHAGILRMYTRKVGGGNDFLERWGLRGFVTYTALRAASWATGWAESQPHFLAMIGMLDLLWLAVPTLLLVINLLGVTPTRIGKLIYLTSVSALYTGFLLSLHFHSVWLMMVFAAAGSMFHAVEYLAVVTHYAYRRRSIGSDGPFRILAKSWLLFLGLYVLILGTIGAWVSRPENDWYNFWLGLNFWAAFVHYAYDGMIWKLRRPETAAALGVIPS
jgi:hypothetical protein